MGRNALLACTHKVIGKQPFVQRDFAAFKYGANGHAVLLTAIVTLDNASTDRAVWMGFCRASALCRKPLCICGLAVRANRTVWPLQGFQVLAG